MRQGSAFIIRPSVPLVIGRLEKDPDKMQAVYDIGYADCSAQIKRLQKWLS
ncbi:MAG: hypothetical protein IJY89_07425 [Clostridia bacterium]|nr:hypothetical protein [Clostridia bacterium]